MINCSEIMTSVFCFDPFAAKAVYFRRLGLARDDWAGVGDQIEEKETERKVLIAPFSRIYR